MPTASHSTRASAAQRGYDGRWRRIRRVHLAREPLCRECRLRGRIRAGEHVDHVIPHRGAPTLLHSAWNLQSLCAECHNRKTAGESQEWTDALWPVFRSETTRPTTIVAGPPGAGKSAYITQHSGPADAVVDLDRIRQGLPRETPLLELLKRRNAEISRKLAEAPESRLWLVATAKRSAEREFWRWSLGEISRINPHTSGLAEVVVLDTDAATCRRRVRNRDGWDAGRLAAITEWWAWYRLEEHGEVPEPLRDGEVSEDGVPLDPAHHWSEPAL